MLTRTEPTIVGDYASTALRDFLARIGDLSARAWWECTPVGQLPDLDQITDRANRLMRNFADALVELKFQIHSINPQVATGIGLVERIARMWHADRLTADDPRLQLLRATMTIGPLMDGPNSDPRGIVTIEDPTAVEPLRTAARSLPAPISTWAMAAVEQARTGGPTRWLIRDVFWLVEGSLRCAVRNEHACLAALRVHTEAVMNDYSEALNELQRLADEALPPDPLSDEERDAVIMDGMSEDQRQDYLLHKAMYRASHACSESCTHRRMPRREAMEASGVYREAVFGAFEQAAALTDQLVQSLDGYAGEMGLNALYPKEESGAIRAMVGNIAKALRRATEQGFGDLREEQDDDRIEMRRHDYSVANMQRRTALTIAEVLAGVPLPRIAMDVQVLVKYAPLTARASMALYGMERPPLAVTIVDLRAANIPESDIDPVMRALRAAVDRGGVANERGTLLGTLQSFLQAEQVRRVERTERGQVPTMRLRVTKAVDKRRSVITPEARDRARLRILMFYARAGTHDDFLHRMAAQGSSYDAAGLAADEVTRLCEGTYALLSNDAREHFVGMIAAFDEAKRHGARDEDE